MVSYLAGRRLAPKNADIPVSRLSIGRKPNGGDRRFTPLPRVVGAARSIGSRIDAQQLLNPPPSGYRIDITWENPSVLQKTKDVTLQANIPHDFGAQ